MAGGEGYTLYMADGSSSAATGTQPGSILEPCELTLKVQLSPAATAGVAVGAGLNVRPQPVTAGRLDDPKLIASVAALLKSKGIAAPEVQITNVLLGDLDGDGNEEAVVAATRLKPVDGGGVSPDATAGDYSLVAVIAAGREPVLVDGQFFPKAAEFSAPLQQRLLDLLDLNGDGRLDVVVASQYYEGNAVSIYTIADGKATESLVTGCGA
jgi:hypothetical protein